MHDLTPLSGLFGGALIGLAAAALMVLTGRLAGVSGIFGGLLTSRPADRGWRLAFVAGLIAAPLVAWLSGAPLPRPAMASNLALVAALRQVASRLGATVAQIAIAWVASRGPDIVPLIGARKRDQLAESLGALNMRLSDSDLAAIEKAVPKDAAAGGRYAEAQLAHLDSERTHAA